MPLWPLRPERLRKDKRDMQITLDQLFQHYPELTVQANNIRGAIHALVRMYRQGGKLLICGNGGSCADSDHISGELLKGFLLPRALNPEDRAAFGPEMRISQKLDVLQKGIPAIPLPQLAAAMTAFSNDANAEMAFAQLVYSLGKPGDVFLGISTSGNSSNVVLAAETAKAQGLYTVALTGEKESALSDLCRITIRVPAAETYRVQEYHLPVYHCICAEVERELFGES